MCSWICGSWLGRSYTGSLGQVAASAQWKKKSIVQSEKLGHRNRHCQIFIIVVIVRLFLCPASRPQGQHPVKSGHLSLGGSWGIPWTASSIQRARLGVSFHVDLNQISRETSWPDVLSTSAGSCGCGEAAADYSVWHWQCFLFSHRLLDHLLETPLLTPVICSEIVLSPLGANNAYLWGMKNITLSRKRLFREQSTFECIQWRSKCEQILIVWKSEATEVEQIPFSAGAVSPSRLRPRTSLFLSASAGWS